MLTASEAADVLNLVEESAVNSLESDSWLQTGGTGGIGLIHRRALRSERFYQAHELPVVSVSASALAPSERSAPAGACDVGVRLVVEAYHAGGDLEAVMEAVREIAARLRRWLSDQDVPGGDRLDGLLDDGDGVVSPGRVSVTDETEENRSYRAKVCLEATIELRASRT